jgi:hypothetical protein
MLATTPIYEIAWDKLPENFVLPDDYWLSWWDDRGNLLLWGSELVERERQRTELEHQRAEEERQHIDRLAVQLRAVGIEPDL